MSNCNKSKLLKAINSVSFALLDLALYLDTHPHDSEALAKYEKYKVLRQQALYEYTENYGPLLIDKVPESSNWQWVCTPWPWEMEAN